MTTYTPVLPEFDPVLQPIGYALAHEFLGGIVVEDEPVAVAPPVPAEAAPVVAEQTEAEQTEAEQTEAEQTEAEQPVTAVAEASVELQIPLLTSLHGSPIDWFAPTAVDDDDEEDDEDGDARFVVRRAS